MMPQIIGVLRLPKLSVSALLFVCACSSSEAPNNGPGLDVAGGAGMRNSGAAGIAGSGAANAAAGSAAAGEASTQGGTSAAGVGGSTAVSVGGASGGGTGGSESGGADIGGGSGIGGTGGTSIAGAGGGSAPGGAGATFFMRYEAEAPINALTYPVERIATEGDAACPANGVKEGANCASGGKVVSQILGRSPCTPATSTTSYDGCQNKGGGVQFKQVAVPADGTYDVTWWYHCGPDTPGHADVYGDTKCGGLDYGTGAGTGCRPHLIDVNGIPVSSTVGGKTALYFQFPCYTAPWSTLHGATTALSLKAGTNTIYIHAPGATTLDAVDVDALDVQAAGHGTAAPPLWPKLVTPVVAGN